MKKSFWKYSKGEFRPCELNQSFITIRNIRLVINLKVPEFIGGLF